MHVYSEVVKTAATCMYVQIYETAVSKTKVIFRGMLLSIPSCIHRLLAAVHVNVPSVRDFNEHCLDLDHVTIV